MFKRLLAGSAAVCLAAAVSGCIIIDSEGEERTVVTRAAAASMAADPYAALYDDAVADSLRPADQTARDALRHPVDMLAFAQVKPGDKVADIRPGAGYFTRLFARVVGPTGRVYAFIPNQTAERENAGGDALAAAYPNVTRVNGALDALTFAEPLDLVFVSQEYHDFHIPRFGVDVARMNAAIFAALKPGGRYVVIDHEAAAGAGITQVGTLHRIEGDYLRREVEAAGFVFEGESAAVANPADDHSLNVFDEGIRGRTDQFVYRFRKPG